MGPRRACAEMGGGAERTGAGGEGSGARSPTPPPRFGAEAGSRARSRGVSNAPNRCHLLARGSGRGDPSGCVGAGAGLGPGRWPVRRREGAGPARGRGRGLALRASGARAG